MKYPLRMNPSNRLRELRKKAGLSQVELAELTGVSQPAISAIENDARPLDLPWMRTFSRVFGCRPADLLADEDNPHRLSDDERSLLEAYRQMEPSQKAMLRRIAEPVQEQDDRRVA